MSPPNSREGAAVLAAVKVRPGGDAVRPTLTATATLTAPARGGRDDPRLGRENACGAVEQENEPSSDA